MKRVVLDVAILCAAVSAAGCKSSPQSDITHDELTRRTQEIMDAIAPGNLEQWKKYFAEDGMYFDEKGRAMDKAALLKDVSPLPDGYSGTIEVVNAKSNILRDTAVLSYDLV